MRFDMNRYILVDRKPVVEPDLLTWARWFENIDNRRVAHTDLPHGRRVSTVFLGLDHNFFGGGPPLLFETMVFPECECMRSSTWDAAEQIHARAVEHWSQAPPPVPETFVPENIAIDAAEGHT